MDKYNKYIYKENKLKSAHGRIYNCLVKREALIKHAGYEELPRQDAVQVFHIKQKKEELSLKENIDVANTDVKECDIDKSKHSYYSGTSKDNVVALIEEGYALKKQEQGTPHNLLRGMIDSLPILILPVNFTIFKIILFMKSFLKGKPGRVQGTNMATLELPLIEKSQCDFQEFCWEENENPGTASLETNENDQLLPGRSIRIRNVPESKCCTIGAWFALMSVTIMAIIIMIYGMVGKKMLIDHDLSFDHMHM